MDIHITLAARTWLMHKGKVVTLRQSPRFGCCGGGARVVLAEVRTPDDPSAYLQLDSEELVIYLAPTLQDQRLVIDLQGFLGMKKLFVVGGSPTRLRASSSADSGGSP